MDILDNSILSALIDRFIPDRCTVPKDCVCPHCDENRMDWLVWNEDEYVVCQSCGHAYDPLRD